MVVIGCHLEDPNQISTVHEEPGNGFMWNDHRDPSSVFDMFCTYDTVTYINLCIDHKNDKFPGHKTQKTLFQQRFATFWGLRPRGFERNDDWPLGLHLDGASWTTEPHQQKHWVEVVYWCIYLQPWRWNKMVLLSLNHHCWSSSPCPCTSEAPRFTSCCAKKANRSTRADTTATGLVVLP